MFQKRAYTYKGSTIQTDGWKAYDGLILNGYDHYRVYHSHDEFVRGKSHVNGIESFWSFTKRRLATFNGVASQKFYLHLKESEFRFNFRHQDLFPIKIKNSFKFLNLLGKSLKFKGVSQNNSGLFRIYL